MKDASPLLSIEKCCQHLDMLKADGTPNTRAFYAWKYRRTQAGRPIKVYRRGSRLLIRLCDLEAALTVEGAKPLRLAESA